MRINFILFLFIAVSIICLTTLESRAVETDAVADPVADYVSKDADFGYNPDNPSDFEALKSARLIRLIYDLNSDGIKDIAMSDSLNGAWGPAGGDWKIYVGRKDGKYVPLEVTFFFNPGAFNVQRIKEGVSKITTSSHLSAVEEALSEFQMTGTDLRLIKSKAIRRHDNAADKKEYARLFLKANNPFPEFCMLKDYLKHNKCKWKKGY